jgi:ABC-type nitrate/sulfonate/bicarbonate transport system permease component
MADDSWKNRTMIIGGLLGTLIGIGGAMMYIRAEEEALEVKRNTLVQHKAIPPAAVLPIAIAVLGVLRQISGLADRD